VALGVTEVGSLIADNYITCANNVTCGNVITGNVTTSGIITSNDTTTISLFSAPCFSPFTYTPAYLIDGTIGSVDLTTSGVLCPIICSYNAIAGKDDGWIVAPGYALIVYYHSNYSIVSGGRPWSGSTDATAQTRSIINFTGTEPLFITSSSLYGSSNQVTSVRVYYQNVSGILEVAYSSSLSGDTSSAPPIPL
jgi:hypothetical protein